MIDGKIGVIAGVKESKVVLKRETLLFSGLTIRNLLCFLHLLMMVVMKLVSNWTHNLHSLSLSLFLRVD